MLGTMILIAVTLTSLKHSAMAANEGPIQNMQQVITSETKLSREKKTALQAVVSDVLGSRPELDADKRLHVSRDLRYYLQERAVLMQQATPERFKVMEDSFRWELGNYASLPPITEQQRESVQGAIPILVSGIRMSIDVIYLDTPEAVRAALAKQVESKVKQDLVESGKIGNYFYPQYLYPMQKQLKAEDVRDKLVSDRRLATKRQAFASVTKDQDADASEEGRQARVRAFTFREATLLTIRALPTISNYMALSALDKSQYTPPPKELLGSLQKITDEERSQQASRTEQLNERARRLMNESDKLLKEAEAVSTRAAKSLTEAERTRPATTRPR